MTAISAVLGVLGACGAAPARCSCLPPREPRTAAEARAYVDAADVVVVGRVVRLAEARPRLEAPAAERGAWGDVAVTLAVRARWRGAPADTLVVHTSSQASMCGVDFRPGASYFVMAGRADGDSSGARARLTAWSCGQTRPEARARDLRRLLGPPSPR